MKIVCDVCGNSREDTGLVCLFCGSKDDAAGLKKKAVYVHKTVNLEAGRPLADAALQRLHEVLDDSARNNINVLTLIHGYGSSGKGGVIRTECRKTLDFFKTKGLISDFIVGEEFNKRSGAVKSLLRRYPQLGTDKHLNKGNRGITLVIFTFALLALPRLLLTTICNATLWS